MNKFKIAKHLALAAATALAIHFFIREPEQIAAPPPTSGKSSGIFDFIREGDTTGFVHWIEQSPDLNVRNTAGETPLIHAAIHNRLAYAIDLIGQGAETGSADPEGCTALHRAAASGFTPLVSLLVEAGADTKARNLQGLTPYDLAIIGNHPSTAAILHETIEMVSPVSAPVETQPVAEIAREITPAVLLSTDFRTWTSVRGEKMEAAFIQNIFDVVILQDRGGAFFRIPLIHLSAPDHVIARQLSGMDPHVLARARSGRHSGAANRGTDSIGMKLRGADGWTVLEGCRLIDSGANDGDSFHVDHEGKEYIFRLYFVDAAETRLAYPQRVQDQADYFNLSRDDTIALGEAASRFTTTLLAGDRFTVATRWEDAKGNSRLPRHFAIIITAQGDLDELLVEEGLVRRYGMPVSGSLGQKKHARLRELEEKAKQSGHGAWGQKAPGTARSSN